MTLYFTSLQVIPYIASQFRKDKIWLRRTKPSKREYQIVLAIDDSSSMADNHSKEVIYIIYHIIVMFGSDNLLYHHLT
jgi:midasin (ATPase involved in ribosome maturation)